MLTTLVAWPAAWVASAVEQAGNGHLQLRNARGSLWNGSAQLVLTGGAGSRDLHALPGHLVWRIAPRWRIGPDQAWGPGLAVTLAAGARSVAIVNLAASWRGLLRWQVQSLDWRLPARVLGGLGAPWNTLAPDGELALSATSLQGEGATLMRGQSSSMPCTFLRRCRAGSRWAATDCGCRRRRPVRVCSWVCPRSTGPCN